MNGEECGETVLLLPFPSLPVFGGCALGHFTCYFQHQGEIFLLHVIKQFPDCRLGFACSRGGFFPDQCVRYAGTMPNSKRTVNIDIDIDTSCQSWHQLQHCMQVCLLSPFFTIFWSNNTFHLHLALSTYSSATKHSQTTPHQQHWPLLPPMSL